MRGQYNIFLRPYYKIRRYIVSFSVEFNLKFYIFHYSLRIPLVHESTEVRAATLRTMRHLTKTKETLQNLNNLHIPYLITRCLDIELDNKVERLQALKLVRNLAFISHQSDDFPGRNKLNVFLFSKVTALD